MPGADLDTFAFPAYRLEGPDGRREAPSAFLTLGHWFEAEKFRTCAPELFVEVLHQPSLKLARKVAKQHQGHWRSDWTAIRGRALACGMVYAAAADVNPERWLRAGEDLVRLLRPLALPERFAQGVAAEFMRLREAPCVGFIGAAAAPPEVVGRRLNAVHKKHEKAWRLQHWVGRHCSWRVHDWAVNQYIPVRYHGEPGARLASPSAGQFARDCRTIVLFEEKGGKDMDAAIKTLRSFKSAQIELDLYARTAAGSLI